MEIISYVVGELETNTYVVGDKETKEAVLIDPGLRSEYILDYIKQENWKIIYVVNTHAHFDHTYGNAFFTKETGAKLLVHEDDAGMLQAGKLQGLMWGILTPDSPVPDKKLKEGDFIEFGNVSENTYSCSLQVIHTPGHSPGGISLYSSKEGIIFVGDTLFAGSIGRTDLPGGSYQTLLNSIKQKLLILPDNTIVYTGHGPKTNIKQEKRTNPFL